MRRVQIAVFAGLAVATVAAFFLTQHLKTVVPLVLGPPRPDPNVINPTEGGVCTDLAGERVSFRKSNVSFFLAHTDTAIVNVVNSFGQQVATVSPGRRMVAGERVLFSWNGRSGNGRGPLVPAGNYYFEFHLVREGRGIEWPDPIRVVRSAPQPRVTSVVATTNVSVTGIGTGTTSGAPTAAGSTGSAGSTSSTGTTTTAAAAGPAVINPPTEGALVHFSKGAYRGAVIEIFRAPANGKLSFVKAFGANPRLGYAVWNGLINNRAAPAGTYLVGVQVLDQACVTGRYPLTSSPVPGSTPRAGVTVRYLSVTPPTLPQAAGSLVNLSVDAAGEPFDWALRLAGHVKTIYHGIDPAGTTVMRVRIPRPGAGLYTLTVHSDRGRVSVPLVAAAARQSGSLTLGGRVLVVLPALSWQGQNPVDDTGDGLPDTLTGGDQIQLHRALVSLTSDFGSEAGVINDLASQHHGFQLTTDVALALGIGPKLSDYGGVILDGPMRWLPTSLVAQLHSYVESGGRVLSVGVGSLQAKAAVSDHAGDLVAGPPTALAPDPFGVHHGAVGSTEGLLITAFSDPLAIFGQIPAISGFKDYQSLTLASGSTASIAGIAASVPAVIGFHLGHGDVIEVGLPDFGSTLSGNIGAQELLTRVWQLLAA